jgi:hypothetical protein
VNLKEKHTHVDLFSFFSYHGQDFYWAWLRVQIIWGYPIRNRNCFPSVTTLVHPRFSGGVCVALLLMWYLTLQGDNSLKSVERFDYMMSVCRFQASRWSKPQREKLLCG